MHQILLNMVNMDLVPKKQGQANSNKPLYLLINCTCAHANAHIF